MSQHSSIPFNPELQDIDRGHEMVILVSVFTVLVFLATAVRIGIKIYDRINLRVEDYFIVLGLVRQESHVPSRDANLCRSSI